MSNYSTSKFTISIDYNNKIAYIMENGIDPNEFQMPLSDFMDLHKQIENDFHCTNCKWTDGNNTFWNCLNPDGQKNMSGVRCDNWERQIPEDKVDKTYDTETAINYMKANPYYNVMTRIKDGHKYTFDKDGTIRVNDGMWLYPSDICIMMDERWEIPNQTGGSKDGM